jgi:biotin carboxylase
MTVIIKRTMKRVGYPVIIKAAGVAVGAACA